VSEFGRWVRRGAAIAVGVGLVAVLLLLAWRAASVLLIVFGGVIIGLGLRGAAAAVTARTRIPVQVAVLVIVVLVVATAGVLAWTLADDVTAQFRELVERVPRAVEHLKQETARHEWGQLVLANVPSSLEELDLRAFVGSDLTSMLGASLGIAAYAAMAAFVMLYVALDPDVYRRGALALVPPPRRQRVAQALTAVAFTLRRWIAGRLVAMLAIGACTALGLWLLDVRLAISLGLLAGALSFVPYIGPILSFVPAALIAMLQGTTTLVWVIALYVVVQTLESYLLTPLVQQRAVRLPPALIITAQVVLGLIFGGVGLLFATPLTAAVLVFVQILYVEDTLHEDAGVRGASTSREPSAA
jgi:predicted PurR-regulated permease PerM